MFKHDEIGEIINSFNQNKATEEIQKSKAFDYYVMIRSDSDKLKKFITPKEVFGWANGDRHINKFLESLKIDKLKTGYAKQLTKWHEDWMFDEIEKKDWFSKKDVESRAEQLYVAFEKFNREKQKKLGQTELELESNTISFGDYVRYLSESKD